MNATGFDTDELRKIMNTICAEVNKETREAVIFGSNKYDDRIKAHVEKIKEAVVRKLQVYADLGSFKVDPDDIQVNIRVEAHPPEYWNARPEQNFVVNIVGETAKKFLGE